MGWLAFVSVAALLACTAPLLENLGYEMALFISLVSSLGAGHLASVYPSRVRARKAAFPGVRYSVLAMYGKTAAHGLLLLLAPLFIALFNGLRVSPCNLCEGLAFVALIPLPSVLLASGFGLLVGLFSPGPKTASAIWFVAFAGSIAAAFHEFHSTPAVFAFGPFFGYFPGVLYDTLIKIDHRLVTYRLAGIAHLVMLLSAGALLADPASLRLSLRRLSERSRVRSLVPLGISIIVALSLYAAGNKLGHRTDRADLEQLLSTHVSIGLLDLYFSPETPKDSVKELTRDAAFSLHQVESFLEETGRESIAVFFFKNRSQKGDAIGARRTNIAKPWRSEVYVIVDRVPHEVLRHELAHAVSASFGHGPFKIAGGLGGLYPNPGLIEGLAVAAQGPRGDLSIHQWSAAMKRLDLLPTADTLFGPGFLDTHASRAYSAAGSFCRRLKDRHGARALKKVYSGASWKDATGVDLNDLWKDWLDFLDKIPLRENDLIAARHRFDRPSVIRSVCVHEVARLHDRASKSADSGRRDELIALLDEAVERSGGTGSTRMALLGGLMRSGRCDEARAMADDMLVDTTVSKSRKNALREMLADLEFGAGNTGEAARKYAELSADAPSNADRRRLQMKAALAALDPGVVAPVIEILARSPGPDGLSEPLAMLSIADAARVYPDNPFLAYLLARQYFRHGDPEGTLAKLEDMERIALNETTPDIALAARRMRGQSLLVSGRNTEAALIFQKIVNDDIAPSGAREYARDWMDRCKYYSGLEEKK